MKRIIFIIGLLVFITNVYSQDSLENRTIKLRPGFCIYPLASDSAIKTEEELYRFENRFIYPLLVINNVVVRDTKNIECFRNMAQKIKIKKIKSYNKINAITKLRMKDVPKDGVLFVTTKKRQYIELNCNVQPTVIYLQDTLENKKSNRENWSILLPNAIYAVTSDSAINKFKSIHGRPPSFIYPLLVLNNVVIRDAKMTNCFRNMAYIKIKIKKIKMYNAIDAITKLKMKDVPKDGVVFVTTKKGYILELECDD